MLTDGVIKSEKNDTKTFTFSNEELQILQPRQALINQYRVLLSDTDFFMQNFIIGQVVPRLGINIEDYTINFNIANNSLTCTRKPPQIIKPPDLVVPK